MGAGVAVAAAGGTPEPAPSSATELPSSETSQSPDTPAPTGGSSSAATTASGDQSKQALAEHGTVPPLREVEREHEHGRAVLEVEFGAGHEVYVDIKTGDVVKVELDDDGDSDDRHDGDDDRHDDRDDDDAWDDSPPGDSGDTAHRGLSAYPVGVPLPWSELKSPLVVLWRL